jgi:hypothetical protein
MKIAVDKLSTVGEHGGMARPPLTPAPVYSLEQACVTVASIRRRRAAARDPDLDFYPAAEVDDDDVDAAMDYLLAHTRVPVAVLADEIPDRAVLVAYLGKRDLERQERRLLALLNAGHDLAVPASAYGERIGLPSRYAVYMRRKRMNAARGPAPAAPKNDTLQAWLQQHHGALVQVAGVFADHRDDLAELVTDGGRRDELIEVIDEAGAHMSARPSRTLASSVAYAVYLLRAADGQPDDDDVRIALKKGDDLREGYVAARAAHEAAQ